VPVLGPRGVEGLRLRADAFLRSCGFVDDDVVVSVNDIEATQLEAYPSVVERIVAQHRAVVVVVRQGKWLVVEIDEEPAPPSP
jgi:type II secretory pathway component PulC